MCLPTSTTFPKNSVSGNTIHTSTAVAQLQQLDDQGGDYKEGPATQKQRRLNVKSRALKLVADLVLACAYFTIKPAFPELESDASNTVKKHFQPRPPVFAKVVKIMNMTKIWQWLLEAKVEQVNPMTCTLMLGRWKAPIIAVRQSVGWGLKIPHCGPGPWFSSNFDNSMENNG